MPYGTKIEWQNVQVLIQKPRWCLYQVHLIKFTTYLQISKQHFPSYIFDIFLHEHTWNKFHIIHFQVTLAIWTFSYNKYVSHKHRSWWQTQNQGDINKHVWKGGIGKGRNTRLLCVTCSENHLCCYHCTCLIHARDLGTKLGFQSSTIVTWAYVYSIAGRQEPITVAYQYAYPPTYY